MSPLTRWFKFNFVGLLGMGVQLVTLVALNHCFPNHYLLATLIAVEAALLHNFWWHTRYTWRDSDGCSRPQQFLRFHFANGVTSLFGNLLLMRLLVRGFHVRIVAANIVAIAVCSVANFFAGHMWAFKPESRTCPTLACSANDNLALRLGTREIEPQNPCPGSRNNLTSSLIL